MTTSAVGTLSGDAVLEILMTCKPKPSDRVASC